MNVDQFWSKVDPTGFCWEWTAYITPNGYGQVRFHGRNQAAHRVAYELLVGSIPSGMVLDHLCRNRKCVNPDHLEVVTRGENVLRGYGPIANNARAICCPSGHEYSESNIYRARGRRYCRSCIKDKKKDGSFQ